RPGPTYVHELVYPAKATKGGHARSSRPTFSQILKASVERHDQTRGWCDRCKRYQQLHTRKTIQSVPAVLMINAAITNCEAKQLWATPNWLPQEIGIIVDQGQFFCYEGQDLKLHVQRGVFNIRVYSLIGVVADINSGEQQKPHLVSLVDVAPSSRDTSESNNFHLFNDFLVRPTNTPEALSFNPGWKLPSVLAYQLKSSNHAIDDTWKANLDPSLLYRRWSASQEADPSKFQLLNPRNEAPSPGTPVAIDAEFVSLQREEIEIKADGSRETIRPSRLGLARVSVLRGGSSPSTSDSDSNTSPTTPDPVPATADLSGIPFIDDYIAIPEPIIDYLTLFSGIHPGDLDRSTSRHTLVSLKVAYKKLWLLLNMGCVFVGHGLPKDFRTINIHVPKRQVVDTVDLFYLKRYQRKLNLRFLAWLLLGEEIQMQVEGHDS
ncbi:poly(A)-specific ribonuclease, partial [Coniosporium uncinatum]